MEKTKSTNNRLLKFAEESNRIEEIYTPRRHLQHAAALEKFLECSKEALLGGLVAFVKAIQPGAFLRTAGSHRVWIGGREAPPASEVLLFLPRLLDHAAGGSDPVKIHQEYEYLHPFLDGNGRSGRALWLWQMINQHGYDLRYGFLRMYYYQTLDAYSRASHGISDEA